MGQRIIIMHPTLERATQNWLQLCRKHKPLIKGAKRNPLSVKFINGDIWGYVNLVFLRNFVKSF